MSELPEKFTIPEDRIPKPWSQGVYNCCVATSITKVLEVIEYVKTGKYTPLSKFYVYGRHNESYITDGGMNYDYALTRLLERGSVPEEMCPIKDEMPVIVERLAALPNINELDKEAEKTKIKSYKKFISKAGFMDEVKNLLFNNQMPLVGAMVGKRHSVVIVGWDGDKLLYHDHNGRSTLYKGRCNEAYYLEGDFEMAKFKDVENRWSEKDIEWAKDKGIVTGFEDGTFRPTEPVTREQICAIIKRMYDLIKEENK